MSVQLLLQIASCHLFLPLNYVINDKNKRYLYPNPTWKNKFALFKKKTLL